MQLDYGREMERQALNKYVNYQYSHGHPDHPDLYASSSGVIISITHPFLAASPDASVFAEIKCPFKYRNLAPMDAAMNSDFMLRKDTDGNLP